jgi:energy-coupling factor transporter ATP-binding protein EcfA2
VSEAALSVQALTFRYRDRQEPSIRDINLDLAPGEFLLVAGASGSGKTTLIRCINGLVPRSYKGELSGSIRMHGQDIQGMPLARISQMAGTVLQDPERQILGSRVLNEVAFGLENLGLARPEIRQRTTEALKILNILHLQDRQTFNLSGGEKQKIALAGVLAMRPDILLLDEPLASLDPASAQEALRMVRQLVDDGITLLMVEHRVEDVLSIHPDRILFMAEGQIRYLGAPAGLSKVVNYHEVKLPAQMIIERARQDPPPPPVQFSPSEPSHPSSAPLVQFEQVGFGYDSTSEVLHNVTLNLNRGDVVAILGPNGAGKTTLVKHAIGLLKPKAGRVLVNGEDTHKQSVAQIANTLGYVFQSPSHMLFAPTVREE